MGMFGNKSNGQNRPTTNGSGRSIATPGSKIKAERAARDQRAAEVHAQKVQNGKGRTRRGDGL